MAEKVFVPGSRGVLECANNNNDNTTSSSSNNNRSIYPSFDDRRSRQIIGTEFSYGSWNTISHQYRRHFDTGILELDHVSWLTAEACISNVPNGSWEPILRIKYDNSNLFLISNWRIILSDEYVRDCGKRTATMEFFDNTPTIQQEIFGAGQGQGQQSLRQGQWIDLSFGLITVPSWCRFVTFKIFGENPITVRGFYFAHFRLQSHHLSWEKERLLLLCYKGMAVVQHHDDDDTNNGNSTIASTQCSLQELPKEIQRRIGQFLIPPTSAP